MVFNYKVSDPKVEVGRVSVVWGAGSGAPSEVRNLLYASQTEAAVSLSWLRQNHPDWIEYKCDRRTIPYQFGSRKQIPVDFTNPDVQDWMISAVVAPALAAGYSGVGFDNLWLYNGWARCGHFSKSGKWVKQYSAFALDPNYAASVLAWAPAMRDRVHQLVAVRNGAHSSGIFGLNYSFTAAVHLSIQNQLVDTADLWLDECGVTQCGRRAPPAASWAASHSMIQGFQGCYFSNNEMNTSDATMRGWALANYLLEKGSCSYLSIERPQQYGVLLDFPEYHLDPGLPLEVARLVSGRWVRRYTNVTVMVDPRTRSFDFVPRTWRGPGT
jgi:putative glycosyl hydrolase-like family 15 (GHL15) protein